MNKFISIVTPAYNESENINELYNRVKNAMSNLSYDYEHILIDNASTDNTLLIAKSIAACDKKFKIIVNNRNFGHIRSPYHGLLQARGAAVIVLASDLQDPPEMIHEFLKEWEHGSKVVFAQKINSEESKFLWFFRCSYYKILSNISSAPLLTNVTGAGLYDRDVIESLRNLSDPYPYFRGLISEFGFETRTIPFTQPLRKRGITKNNFLTLYDMAILGITTNSRYPLHFITILGVVISLVSIFISLIFLFAKFVFWDRFDFGIAPVLFGIFFLGGIQLFFLGMIGEYVGVILARVRNVPHVYERERVNFD